MIATTQYLQPLLEGGDGPAQFVVLARQNTTTTNLAEWAPHHGGFRAGGFVSPPQNPFVTIAGNLVCRPQVGMGILGASR